jgi:DMSO/TMAO reductase YedYZ heme-binding membrane subunit
MDKSRDGAPARLLENSRFYALVVGLLLSIFMACFLRVVIPDERLYFIRLGQIYGFTAIVYWYGLLLISPLTKFIGPRPWLLRVGFTRRALGVLVAYFAFLHSLISFIKQLGGLEGLTRLPLVSQYAFYLGLAALFVLAIMTILSVDTIIRRLHFKNWKLLGRISYAAGVAVLVHTWLIGTHVSWNIVQITALIMLLILFALESAKYAAGIRQKYDFSKLEAALIGVTLWLILGSGLLAVKAIPSYSTQHSYEGRSTHGH